VSRHLFKVIIPFIPVVRPDNALLVLEKDTKNMSRFKELPAGSIIIKFTQIIAQKKECALWDRIWQDGSELSRPGRNPVREPIRNKKLYSLTSLRIRAAHKPPVQIEPRLAACEI